MSNSHWIDPPEEAFEIAHRNAVDALTEAGQDAAFVLILASPLEGDEEMAETRLLMSSGRERFSIPELVAKSLGFWLFEQEESTE